MNTMSSPQNGSNGMAKSNNGYANSQPSTESIRQTVSQMLDGTYFETTLPDIRGFGTFGPLVQNIFGGYQLGGADGARQARDAIVRLTPELEPVLGRPDMPHKWEEQLLTLVDAYKPRPPLEYVVSGLFPIPSLSVVYGPPGAFKSMFLADLALCVAAGLPFLEPLPDSGATGTTRATKQVSVLWLDFDNGPRKTHERFEAVGRAHGLPENAPVLYLSMPNPWLDASCDEEVDELIALLNNHDIGLLVIDNLTSISGKVEENTAAMAGVMTNLRRLSESANAAVVVIHHQRKGNGEKGNAGDQLRGHSSINAAIDLALKVERKQNAEAITVESTKTRGEDVWPFHAAFAREKKPDGELKTARFYGTVGDDASQKGVTDNTIRAAVLAVIEERGSVSSKQSLKTLVKQRLPDAGLNRIADRIDDLVAEKKLLQNGQPGAALSYTLPE